VALSVFAGLTTRVRLGTSVLVLPLRQPAILAKQLASLDYLSGGRLIVGVGLGENPSDYAAAGVPFAERGPRCDELIAALRAAWARTPKAFAGRFYNFEQFWIDPPPVQNGGPPIWVGGVSNAALRRAGTLGDGWHAYLVDPESYRRGLAAVRAHAEQAGRDPNAITASVKIPVILDDNRDRAYELARKLLGRAAAGGDPVSLGAFGNPDDVMKKLQEYVAAGATNIVFNSLAPNEDPAVAYKRIFLDVLMPLRGTLNAQTGYPMRRN
jgi:probable F420-dependent oxidoreductase